MLRPVPVLEEYGLSAKLGFLPNELPLAKLPDPRYNEWETIVANLPALIRSRKLRHAIDRLPILDTAGLKHDVQWRRAYSLLCFMMQGFVWAGDLPKDHIPPQVAIPLLAVSNHLDILPVATYAAVCLWNFRPVFNENIGELKNLASLHTFTGLADESWFYSISVAIEVHGAPILDLGLSAIEAARRNDSALITNCLCTFAERLTDLTHLLQRMHEGCDPARFYHQIRPYLAGSKNMADAGLPYGVRYEDGSGTEKYRQYSGGSNAQSSLIQFFDVILGIDHSPTRLSGSNQEAKGNFIQDMRQYMPTRHAEFLHDVEAVANIREYVGENLGDVKLCVAYNACVTNLRAFRDKHIDIVARYIIIPSRKVQAQIYSPAEMGVSSVAVAPNQRGIKWQRGTGGTALLPFLQQARNETCVPVIAKWATSVKGDKLQPKKLSQAPSIAQP